MYVIDFPYPKISIYDLDDRKGIIIILRSSIYLITYKDLKTENEKVFG